MKIPKPLLLMHLLLLQIALSAQVQWYQNQDGNNQFPNGTTGTSVQSFTPTSFLACYLWRIGNDTYTWKISKSHINGTEQRTFLVSGTTSQAEMKAGRFNSLYVLQRNFPFGQNSEYIIYKLDSNLNIKAQRTISFPGSFNIFNLNCFEIDKWDNVYLAGDGQYPNGPGFNSASFVMKTDRNLQTQWSRMDSSQTSYTRLHIDRWGRVILLADFYTFFPEVHISKISSNGQYVQNVTIQTDPGRYSLFSALDDEDNLLVYGGKTIDDTTQAMYLYKVSRINGAVLYRKTYFKAPGSQLNDVKVDRNGKIFTLVTMYLGPDNQVCRISRINSNNGNITWSHSMSYAQDSCNLTKLVINENDQFYAIGQRVCHTYFSKGFAMRMKKSGQMDGNFPAPDSVAFQRLHWLSDGITDFNNRLIAIGGTSDLDTTNFMTSYLRAFAVRFGNNNNCNASRGSNEEEMPRTTATETDNEKIIVSPNLSIYPNPVQSQLIISGLQQEEYNGITVFDMQGAVVLRQPVNGIAARMDVSSLSDGVYLLLLRSSVTLKEKSIKFVVRK